MAKLSLGAGTGVQAARAALRPVRHITQDLVGENGVLDDLIQTAVNLFATRSKMLTHNVIKR